MKGYVAKKIEKDMSQEKLRISQSAIVDKSQEKSKDLSANKRDNW